jgi:hypothetical protein
MTKTALSSLALVASLAFAAPAAYAQSAWDKVAAALGKTGTEMPDQVDRVGFPRTYLKVSVDGVEIKPTFALGGWLAFKSIGAEDMVMGDLVLTESEINPVMAKLFAGGISVTAVHNHLLRAQPATFYMHVAGHGDPEKLAAALHAALGESKIPMGASAASPAPPPIDLDTAKLNEILGARGNPNGRVYGFGIPRADPITDHGRSCRPPGAPRSPSTSNRWEAGEPRSPVIS